MTRTLLLLLAASIGAASAQPGPGGLRLHRRHRRLVDPGHDHADVGRRHRDRARARLRRPAGGARRRDPRGSQVREAYGSLLPRVDASSAYTRNVVQANPFAGTGAGGIFGGLGAIGWIQFNENARTDDGPDDAADLVRGVQPPASARGRRPSGFNPGQRDQPLRDRQHVHEHAVAVAADLLGRGPSPRSRARGAWSRSTRSPSSSARTRSSTRRGRAYYQALLAREQAQVQRASLERSRETFDDAALLVAQGVRPVLERLNAEVDLANAETGVVQAQAQAETARDQLLLTLGLPVTSRVVLDGRLAPPEDRLFQTVGLAAASERALDLRPDVRQAALAVELNEVPTQYHARGALPHAERRRQRELQREHPRTTGTLSPRPIPGTRSRSRPARRGSSQRTTGSRRCRSGSGRTGTCSTASRRAAGSSRTRSRSTRPRSSLSRSATRRRWRSPPPSASSRARGSGWGTQARTVETAETAFAFASARLEEGVASQVDVRISSQNLDPGPAELPPGGLRRAGGSERLRARDGRHRARAAGPGPAGLRPPAVFTPVVVTGSD